MPETMATDDEPGGDHARGAALLSGARPRRNAVSPYLGATIDQLIGKVGVFSRLELAVFAIHHDLKSDAGARA
jgi:hypothetical protein